MATKVYDCICQDYYPGTAPAADDHSMHIKRNAFGALFDYLKDEGFIKKKNVKYDDFKALTSDMFTDEGNKLMEKCYNKWRSSINLSYNGDYLSDKNVYANFEPFKSEIEKMKDPDKKRIEPNLQDIYNFEAPKQTTPLKDFIESIMYEEDAGGMEASSDSSTSTSTTSSTSTSSTNSGPTDLNDNLGDDLKDPSSNNDNTTASQIPQAKTGEETFTGKDNTNNNNSQENLNSSYEYNFKNKLKRSILNEVQDDDKNGSFYGDRAEVTESEINEVENSKKTYQEKTNGGKVEEKQETIEEQINRSRNFMEYILHEYLKG